MNGYLLVAFCILLMTACGYGVGYATRQAYDDWRSR